jgi:Ca2+-binding EF-hand superfamily protein
MVGSRAGKAGKAGGGKGKNVEIAHMPRDSSPHGSPYGRLQQASPYGSPRGNAASRAYSAGGSEGGWSRPSSRGGSPEAQAFPKGKGKGVDSTKGAGQVTAKGATGRDRSASVGRKGRKKGNKSQPPEVMTLREDQFSGHVPDTFENFMGAEVASRVSIHNAHFYEVKWEMVRDHILKRYSSARRAFRDIDASRDGSVTLGELQDALDRMRVPWRVICDVDSIRQLLRGHPKMKDGSFSITDLFGVDAIDADSDSDDALDDDPHKTWQAKRFHNLDEVEKFTKWAAAGNKWVDLYTIFGNDARGRTAASPEAFVKKVTYLGYTGNAIGIYPDILDECMTMRDRANRQKYGGSDWITLKQLKAFEQKAMYINGKKTLLDDGNPVSRLVDKLKRLESSVLGGWVRHIDIHSTGKVGEKIFAQQLRQLQLQQQVTLIWRQLRPNKADCHPVELHEIAPNEAKNLEDFAEVIWDKCGFSIDRAWECLDVHNHKYLNEQTFKEGVQRLGFKGNAHLIFVGLGSKGADRMLKEDLAYMKKISRVSKKCLQPHAEPVHHLIHWVHSVMRAPENFITQLGISATNPTITVGDLAARLTTLGYDGDALTIANRASRLEGGTFISAASLHLLLSGERRTNPHKVTQSPAIVTAGRARSPAPRPAWDDAVNDFGLYNEGAVANELGHKFGQTPKPRCQRTYFGQVDRIVAPGRAPFVLRASSADAGKNRAARRGSIINARAVVEATKEQCLGRPDWNGRIHDTGTHNAEHCSSMRCLFSNPDIKEHKENHKKIIQNKEMAKKGAKAEANRLAFEAPVKGYLKQMTSGERVLIKIQQIIDKEKIRSAQFFSDLDTDGGGQLDIDELGEGLRGLGFHLSEEELSGLFSIIDKDGGGFVSIKELVAAMREVSKKLEQITSAKRISCKSPSSSCLFTPTSPVYAR